MKKALLIVIALLVVVALALPQVVGMQTQEQLNTRVAEVWSNKVFDVKPTAYDRGWFSSIARVELGFTEDYKNQIEESIRQNSAEAQVDLKIANLREYLDTTIPLRVDVKHGPFIMGDEHSLGLATTETHLDSDAEWVEEFLNLAQIPHIFEVHTYTGFSGVTDFDANMPAFTIQEQDMRLAVTGVEMTGTFEYADLRLVSDTRLDGLEFEAGDLKTALRNMSIRSDNVKVSDFLWTGTVEGGLDEFSMNSTAPQNPFLMKMEKLALTSDTRLADEKLSVDIDYKIAKISMPDGIAVDDLEIGVAFQNIDIATVENFYEVQQSMPAQTESSLGDLPPEMQIALHGLFSSSPSMQFDPLTFKWKNEPLMARVNIDINGDSLPPQDEFDVMNIGVWMNMVSATMNIDLSQPLATEFATLAARQQLQAAVQQGAQIPVDQIDTLAGQQAPILLFTLEQQGMITGGGHGYVSEITYIDGELLVNGQPIPLGSMQ